MAGTALGRFPLHLALGAKAVPQPEFTGEPSWYKDYEDRTADDGAEGRLMTVHAFSSDWESWEMHPAGDEVVLCLSGEITLHQEYPDGRRELLKLHSGEYVVNPPQVWHTADIADQAEVLFITAGAGTQQRTR